jgi:hypothetical protein
MLMESNFPRCRHTKNDVRPHHQMIIVSEVNNWPIINGFSIRRNLCTYIVIYRLSKLHIRFMLAEKNVFKSSFKSFLKFYEKLERFSQLDIRRGKEISITCFTFSLFIAKTLKIARFYSQYVQTKSRFIFMCLCIKFS